jgi:cytochrome c553
MTAPRDLLESALTNLVCRYMTMSPAQRKLAREQVAAMASHIAQVEREEGWQAMPEREAAP